MSQIHPNKKTAYFSKPTQPTTSKLQPQTELPLGWDIARVQRILKGFEPQHQQLLKNRETFTNNKTENNMIEVPEALVPDVLKLIEKYKTA